MYGVWLGFRDGRESGLDQQADRRGFLSTVIKVSAAVIGAVVVIPSVGLLLQPIIQGSKKKRAKILFKTPEDGRSAGFVLARIEGAEETDPGVFVKQQDGKVTCLSAVCTHAGCAVQWQSDANQFYCPCHQGRFDARGTNISGPPPRPLDSMVAILENGEVIVEVEEV